MSENDGKTTQLLEKLDNQFKYHMAEGAQPLQYATMRGQCLDLAQLIAVLVPECEERDEALKRLNEVMFWANAGIARHAKSNS